MFLPSTKAGKRLTMAGSLFLIVQRLTNRRMQMTPDGARLTFHTTGALKAVLAKTIPQPLVEARCPEALAGIEKHSPSQLWIKAKPFMWNLMACIETAKCGSTANCWEQDQTVTFLSFTISPLTCI